MTELIQNDNDMNLNANNQEVNTENQSNEIEFLTDDSFDVSYDDNYENVSMEEFFKEIETTNKLN
ncbi:MAG: hypothetical protein A2X02_08275 [Bacteroidetes bacterium GWF2_29_10]|nr:MAG: hypothetical protein A2X02_08275 [Bacteroidetes bacterium GWF2_29_10]